jgi:hypothetical protein
MFAKRTEARTREQHRPCPLFADRTQEDGKRTSRGRIPQFTASTFGGNALAMLGFGLLIAFFARSSVSG